LRSVGSSIGCCHRRTTKSLAIGKCAPKVIPLPGRSP